MSLPLAKGICVAAVSRTMTIVGRRLGELPACSRHLPRGREQSCTWDADSVCQLRHRQSWSARAANGRLLPEAFVMIRPGHHGLKVCRTF
jgi:hypothetical protein